METYDWKGSFCGLGQVTAKEADEIYLIVLCYLYSRLSIFCKELEDHLNLTLKYNNYSKYFGQLYWAYFHTENMKDYIVSGCYLPIHNIEKQRSTL